MGTAWAWALVGTLALAVPAAAAEGDQGDVNILLRGGLGGYTGDLSATSEVGPTWGATLGLQPSNVLGLELGYEGSQNQLADPLTAADAGLTRHGGSALIKLGLPFLTRVRPFVGAGMGLSRVGVSGETFGRYQSDLMQEIPLAGGIELNSGPLTAGLRSTYRILVDEGFAAAAGPAAEGGLLDVSAHLGGRF